MTSPRPSFAQSSGTARRSIFEVRKPPGSTHLGAHQKLTTSVRTEFATSKTPSATWHGAASVGSSPPPQAHKSFPRYRGGVLIRAARPRATSPHSARISRNLALTGGQLLMSRGGSFLASAAVDHVPDQEVLMQPARTGRVLVSHDFQTMPEHFRNFVRHHHSPGVFFVPQYLPVGLAV
jgi:hypothetical protein